MLRTHLILTTLAIALVASACGGSDPTPTPPYGLPPLTLPQDEAPHDFQTEWWYFNLLLTGDAGERYALHDVIFQVQETTTNRTLYVRQIGLGDVAAGTHVSTERLRATSSPLGSEPDSFEIAIGTSLMAGESGHNYRLVGAARGTSYDLELEAVAPPLLHDDDGLVDFGAAGVTYYYTRPRLQAQGTITTAAGEAIAVSGLGWLDKQWGDFQPIAVTWDWASVQLDDGTDLMLTRLFDAKREPIDVYATLRLPGGDVEALTGDDFTFEPVPGDTWHSERTGTTYSTRWRVRIPGADLDFTLVPLIRESEFVSAALGVTYWEAGADAIDTGGSVIGQGFVELNWRPGTTP